jgi:CRP-like cAMP-binding protein
MAKGSIKLDDSIQKERLLLSNIENHIALCDADKKYLTLNFEKVVIPKKTIFQEQGKLCKKIFFVEGGIIRAFHNNSEGKEATIMFAIEDWWVTDMASFVNGEHAYLSLETIEDAVLYSITADALGELLLKIPKLEKYFRILYQRAYVREQIRALDSISKTVEERYLDFLNKYPQIASKVTQKQIASYLGVTPEFLSTIKNNIRT